MTSFAHRLRRARKGAGLTQDQLARRVGLKRQSISAMERTGGVERTGKLVEIAEALGVRPQWLRSGEEPREAEWVAAGDGAAPVMDDFTLVPQYAVTASLGAGREIVSEQIVDHLAFKTEWLRSAMGLNPGKCALITAKGDSMEPAIGDGDLLLLDLRELRTLDPSVYVLRHEDSLYAKRVQRLTDGQLRIISDNKFYEPETVDPQDVEIIGRVVWIGSKA